MNLRRDLFAIRVFEPLCLPALVAGGLLLTVAGGAVTISRQYRCAEIGVERGYEESYVVPGRHQPDQCVCRGKRDANGSLDTSISESVPLF